MVIERDLADRPDQMRAITSHQLVPRLSFNTTYSRLLVCHFLKSVTNELALQLPRGWDCYIHPILSLPCSSCSSCARATGPLGRAMEGRVGQPLGEESVFWGPHVLEPCRTWNPRGVRISMDVYQLFFLIMGMIACCCHDVTLFLLLSSPLAP